MKKTNYVIIGALLTILGSCSLFMNPADGKLARHYKVTSKFGSILDVGTDFFFIFTASYLLYTRGLLPLGIVIVIVVKFAEFCFTSYLINKKSNLDKTLFFDKIGRFVAIILYSLPLFSLRRFCSQPIFLRGPFLLQPSLLQFLPPAFSLLFF